ncbi:MAG: site-2 protease family protein [Parcubacteria group bacterium]
MILLSLMDNPVILLAWLVAVVVTLTVHEFCHALVANSLGDSTARDAGRLTLNPLPHISWLGLATLLLIGFGWGNPVPFNPYNLKWPRFGPAAVALAGPASNLIMAVISALVFHFLAVGGIISPDNLLTQFLQLLFVLNISLMVFNLIPVPPLDGSKVLFAVFNDSRYSAMHEFLETRGTTILLLLIVADNFFGLNILSGLLGFFINFFSRFLS